MLTQLPEGSELWSDATEIKRASERAHSVTRGLLAFSRRETDKRDRIILNEVVTDMGSLLRPLIGSQILLTTVLEPNLWLVESGRRRQRSRRDG